MVNTLKRIANPETLVRLGKQLRDQRLATGTPQGKVRGMRQATVSRIENGNDVTLDTLVTYAAALGLELAFVPIGQGLREPMPITNRGLPPAKRPIDLLTEFSDLQDES